MRGTEEVLLNSQLRPDEKEDVTWLSKGVSSCFGLSVPFPCFLLIYFLALELVV
jgi:hypothetical protein